MEDAVSLQLGLQKVCSWENINKKQKKKYEYIVERIFDYFLDNNLQGLMGTLDIKYEKYNQTLLRAAPTFWQTWL